MPSPHLNRLIRIIPMLEATLHVNTFVNDAGNTVWHLELGELSAEDSDIDFAADKLLREITRSIDSISAAMRKVEHTASSWDPESF